MRPTPNPLVECYRIRRGLLGSDSTNGNNGAFLIQKSFGHSLQVIASDGLSWEHVSVCPAAENRVPTWEEMCFIKDLFWGEEEVVIQYHPAKSSYKNFNPNVLHLWAPIGQVIPCPPTIMIAP